MADQKETIILDFEVDTKDAVVSIDALTKANKALRDERKNLDLSTEAGIKRVKDINTQLDKNTQTIKNNSSTIEKNRLEVGNYKGAIDKLIPGLGATANGFIGVGKAIYTALIANPIGAIIAGIVLAITGLIKIFTSTEEGGDKLARVMAALGAAFDVLYDRAAKVGGAFVKLFTGDFIGAIDDSKEAVSGLTDELVREGKEAAALADILDDLEDREISYEAAASATELEIKRLIVASKNRNLTEQQKIDLLDKANKLEIESNGKLKGIKQDELAAAIRKIQLTAEGAKMQQKWDESQLEFAQRIIDNTKLQSSERKELSKAFKEFTQAEGQSLVLQEKIGNQIDAQNQKQQQKIDKLNEIKQKDFEAYQKKIEQNEKEKESNDALFESVLKKLDKIEEKEKEKRSNKAINAANDEIEEQARIDRSIQASQEASDKVIQIQEDEAKKKLDIASKNVNDIIDTTQQLASGIISVKEGQYKLEENKLQVSLANQKTQLNGKYKDELASLNELYSNQTISKEEYDADVLGLNQKFQALTKDAEIKQANELNEVKKKEFEANKKNQIASAIADAARAVLGAVAATFGGPIIKGIAAAAQIAFNAIQINQIRKSEFVPTTFRTGGYTGDGDPDQLAGLTHKREFVMPAEVVSRYGKDHFQSYMDGSIVANGLTQSANTTQQMAQSPVYLDFTEFRKFSRQVEVKESIVKA